MTASLDYNSNTYLAITLSQNSPIISSPQSLLSSSVSGSRFELNHVGQVGQLSDVQLWSIPKENWDANAQDILSFLKGKEGVESVDVQELKQRTRRDEF